MAGNLWFIYALLASAFWGVTYAVAGRLFQHGFSVPVLLVIELMLALPVFLVIAYVTGALKSDIALLTSRPNLWPLLFSLAVFSGIASFFIASSISEKNATLAALVEISYPLFTFAFVWLIFREVQLSWETAIGGLLIISGSFLMCWKS